VSVSTELPSSSAIVAMHSINDSASSPCHLDCTLCSTSNVFDAQKPTRSCFDTGSIHLSLPELDVRRRKGEEYGLVVESVALFRNVYVLLLCGIRPLERYSRTSLQPAEPLEYSVLCEENVLMTCAKMRTEESMPAIA